MSYQPPLNSHQPGRPSRLRPMKPPWQAMCSQNSRALNISGWAWARSATTTIQVHGTDSLSCGSDCFWLSARSRMPSAPRSPTIAPRDAAVPGLHLRLLLQASVPFLDHPALLVIARDHAGHPRSAALGSLVKGISPPARFPGVDPLLSDRPPAPSKARPPWDDSMAAPDAPWHNAPRASPRADP